MDSKADVKRRLIIDTAKQIIHESGITSLTLDAVAKQANISKGGLLYHYSSKEALIKGIALSIFEDLDTALTEYAKKDPVETGKWTRAMIEVTKDDLYNRAELNVAVMASSLLDKDVAEGISNSYQRALTKLENDGISPVTASVIRLALDGLYYSQMLHVAPLDKKMQTAVLDQLTLMTRKEDV
ncbi:MULTISPECIES: TetR/AcrR family transcriptional regulator [Bacillaceae]|uniref:TetR/AcrR family transcriptional regulator n=1 Tax=Bacillaceae TaxID=186817 RepID=UPI001E3D6B3A|nr:MULTISPECIES: TetR/AcrR family transcriptional regulator [Bacillaceae]MCE4048171.1 TetR/AcrR family transcriptional regulator [Bacillus sp. Au-Bac7]MCM3033389.1 TetR/AcrR family transcriptional regulator [Niallia sp. MER 6]UPO89058.1 TetR/AcrR family transcriptional regulator [Niallia sp. Man26]